METQILFVRKLYLSGEFKDMLQAEMDYDSGESKDVVFVYALDMTRAFWKIKVFMLQV